MTDIVTIAVDSLSRLEADMEACEQTKGQSVLAHGRSVWAHYSMLLEHIANGRSLGPEWRIPTWLTAYRHRFILSMVSAATARQYLVYHDCGKPYCRIVGEDGKVHFPEHPQCSANTWIDLGGSALVANLMRLDMMMHTLKGDDVRVFGNSIDGQRLGPTLLIAALAEMHANARMFGGIESDSFKIKWAGLNRRGKTLCGLWFGDSALVNSDSAA